jgi:peroxiredoxin
LKAWAKSLGGISFPLLSDFNPFGAVAATYGVKRGEGFSERAIFIIDRDGIIRYIDVHDIGDKPSNEILFAEIAKACA